MSPRSMAIAALIVHDCSTHGWDRTAAEIADDLAQRYPAARDWQPSAQQVERIARAKGWSDRLRGSAPQPNEPPPATMRIDAELDALSGARGASFGGYA